MIFVVAKSPCNINMVSKFLFPLLVLFLVFQPFLVHSRTLKPEKKSYFKNFENLQGSIQEGQTVSGLIEIKQYLQRFGYYPSDAFELNDEFDRQLKSAIQTFQNNYHLNVTGTLNPETIKIMMVPRCGVPDIVSHSTSSKQFHNSRKFHLVSHYTFFNGSPKWNTYDLTYRLSGRQVVDQQAFRDIISRAFKRWSDVTKFNFQEAPQGENANVTISFESGDHGDGLTFDGAPPAGRVWAHAFAPTRGLLHFDADDNWSTANPNSDQVDLESVAIHEIGHILGLYHSMDQTAIMYAYIEAGAVKRDLVKDDIDGIQALYTTN